MSDFIDLTIQKIGRLTVLKRNTTGWQLKFSCEV